MWRCCGIVLHLFCHSERSEESILTADVFPARLPVQNGRAFKFNFVITILVGSVSMMFHEFSYFQKSKPVKE